MRQDGNLKDSSQVKWGLSRFGALFERNGLSLDFAVRQKSGAEEGYGVQRLGMHLTISASHPKGALYALVDIAERLETGAPLPPDWSDAPRLKFRGYALGLQKPKAHYSGHKAYDWPVVPEHFPWFFDKAHMEKLLDRLALQRCNWLCFWAGHPFSYFVTLEAYPEMQEISAEQLAMNAGQLRWILAEGEKRGIAITFQFYNIHMPPPLAKARGWEVLKGEATPELCTYTRKVIETFVAQFPTVGLVVCMGELLREEDQGRWLEEVILQGVSEGAQASGSLFPPVILRGHQFAIENHFDQAKMLYPNLWTMYKHNDEMLMSHKTCDRNCELAERYSSHIVNVHLCSNLEPFTWSGARFIQKTAKEVVKQGGTGLHIYPLRYWDWPDSSHVHPLGDQLDEHFIWWSAWGRYAWNPQRGEQEENRFWIKALQGHYRISEVEAEALLTVFNESADFLPCLARLFMISSGNRQSTVLGQFLVPLAFSRTFYTGGGYSMSQLWGYPLLGEQFWSPTPVMHLNHCSRTATALIALLDALKDPPEIVNLIRQELVILQLLLDHFGNKAKACACYFQSLADMPGSSEQRGLRYLRKSVDGYRKIVEKTEGFFVDAGSIKHYRSIPLPVEMGFEHWRDCLPQFEEELMVAETGGIKALLKHYSERVSKFSGNRQSD